MYQKLLSVLLALVLFQTAFAQSPTAQKPDEAEAEFKKQTLLFLRETAGDLNNLRSVENRISFASELAGLMWFEDEKEARAVFLNVSSDFKQLVMNYDSQLNQIELSSVEDGGGGGGGLLFGGDDSDKGKLERKMRIAMMVRQQVASSIAEHDPQLAFDFYYDSINAIANVVRRKQYEGQDKYFEGRLLSQIAEKDAAKAAEMGRKSLANGVTYYHVELLKKIYAKDADKGAEFADAVVSKLKDQSGEPDNNSILSSILGLGIENFEKTKKEGRKKKPMFTEQGLRDLSELLAQKLLDMDPDRGDEVAAYVGTVEKYAPGRAVQIRSKFGLARSNGSGNGDGTGIASAYSNTAVRVPAGDPNRYRASANTNSPIPRTETEADRARAEKQKADEQLMADVAGLSTKKLPKEERDKVVGQARKIVSEMKSKDEKIMALSMLAAQVAKAGDKELASEIMKDAHALINPQPKNYKDFMYVWMLASGYAEADPEKAFPLLEDAILRLNDTITGVVRVAEFIDVAGEIVDDGEVQVGAFGGSMIREMTQGLGLVNPTLRSLARADMAKTKGLTNSFDRPEVRVLAKMLILRAIMSKNKQPGEDIDIELPSAVDTN